MKCKKCSNEIDLKNDVHIEDYDGAGGEELDIRLTCAGCGQVHYTFIEVDLFVAD